MITERRLMKEVERLYKQTIEYISLFNLHDERITIDMVESEAITTLCTINAILPAIIFYKNRRKLFIMRSELHSFILQLDANEI